MLYANFPDAELPRHLAISSKPSIEPSRNANQRTIIIVRIRRLRWDVWFCARSRSRAFRLFLKQRARGPWLLRSARIREAEKSCATNGMWQRVISPRLHARRNNRFLFLSFRGSIFPLLLSCARRPHAYREARYHSPYPGTPSHKVTVSRRRHY